MEAQFRTRNLRNQFELYNHVVAALPQTVVEEVLDLLQTPPEAKQYDALKEAILQRTSVSESERLRMLWRTAELGDRKPSQLLRHMRSLAGSTPVDDKLLLELWFERLPDSIKAILAPSRELPLDKIAEMADGIATYTAPSATVTSLKQDDSRISNVEKMICELARQFQQTSMSGRNRRSPRSRSRPRSRVRSRSPSTDRGLCWFHQEFGNSARKCRPPCSFKKQQGNARAAQ